MHLCVHLAARNLAWNVHGGPLDLQLVARVCVWRGGKWCLGLCSFCIESFRVCHQQSYWAWKEYALLPNVNTRQTQGQKWMCACFLTWPPKDSRLHYLICNRQHENIRKAFLDQTEDPDPAFSFQDWLASQMCLGNPQRGHEGEG